MLGQPCLSVSSHGDIRIKAYSGRMSNDFSSSTTGLNPYSRAISQASSDVKTAYQLWSTEMSVETHSNLASADPPPSLNASSEFED
jgi:hypothetical protein